MECFAGLAAFDFYQSIRKTINDRKAWEQYLVDDLVVIVFSKLGLHGNRFYPYFESWLYAAG